VENALYADPRICEAAAVGVPDERLGEVVAAVVYGRPGVGDCLTEQELIAQLHPRSEAFLCILFPHYFNFGMARLPRFAIPVMIVLTDKPFGERVFLL